MERILTDLRVTLRAFRRAPTIPVTALLTLSIGIGMAIAMLTVCRAVLQRPLPVQDQDGIVLPRALDARGTDLALLGEEYREVAHDSRAMTRMAGVAHQGAFESVLLDGDRSVVLRAAWVTGNFFEVLGARAALGRFFTAVDESEREPATIVLSYGAWRQRFAGDSTVIGRQLFNAYTRHAYTIVGVAPAGLDYPVGVEYWSPTVYAGGLDVVARLAPGESPDAAGAEFLRLARGAIQATGRQPSAVRVTSLSDAVVGSVRPALIAILAAALLLLGAAALNVGSLLLLRFATRHDEIAVRRALGAGESDVARAELVAGGVLAVGGAAGGVALAVGLLRVLVAVAPATLPRIDLLRLTGAPIASGVVAALLVVAAAMAAPLLAARLERGSSLQFAARAVRATRGRRAQRVLVSAQMALACLVVSGAGLLVKSYQNLTHVDLGFRAERLSLVYVAAPFAGTGSAVVFGRMLDVVPPALRPVPGVEAVTPVAEPPFFGPQVFNASFEAEGQVLPASIRNTRIPWEVGGSDYFRTFRIRLLAGRGLSDDDRETSPRVVVVSASAAKLLWPGLAPLGRRLRFPGDTSAGGGWRTVVGVAADTRYRGLREPSPTVYFPARQLFSQGIFAVRTTGALADELPALRRAVQAAYPGASIVRAETLDDLLDTQVAWPRLSALALTAFAAAILLLASVGLYGVVAHGVRERAREFGIRSALGATSGQLRRHVLAGALAMTGSGALVGLAGTVATSRVLAAALFEVRAADPLVMVAATAGLLGVACVAAAVPARRATRIDPGLALRAD